MQKFSFHNHTYRCRHAQADLTEERSVREYAERGFTHMALTDHCPWKTFCLNEQYRGNMLYAEKQEYLEGIRRAKEKYQDVITVYSGFETEHLPFLLDEIEEMRSEVDLMVLGQHYIYDSSSGAITHLYDPRRPFGDRAPAIYAACIEDALQHGWPDILAHPDIIMLQQTSFGPKEEESAHRIFAAAAKTGTPVEINLCQVERIASGEKTSAAYPNREFWRVAAEYPVKVLYGIDCHWIRQLDMYEQSLAEAERIIGKDILSRLDFCTAEDVLKKRGTDRKRGSAE